MVTVVRVTQVLLMIALAFVAISFVIALGRPETGALEKLALVALIALCVFLAARLSTLSTRIQAHFSRRDPAR
jgi:hypothetical protein